MNFPASVTLREVGLRDGLQSRPQVVSTEVKIEMMRGLIDAGFKNINAVAFVHPRVTPQMADAEQLLDRLGRLPGVAVSALIPNVRGMARARACAERGLIQEAILVHATTKSVLVANGFASDLDSAFAALISLAADAKAAGLRTIVFVSATFGCSIEGFVDPSVPLEIGERLAASNVVDELVFSDSTGQANPAQVNRFFQSVKARFGNFPITAHFHDTRGAGLANIIALLDVGIGSLTIDCAFGGLGGDIPFLPDAGGNVCTEDVVSMLDGCGVETGINLHKVLEVAALAAKQYPDPLPSRLLPVGPVRWSGGLAARSAS